MKFVMLLITAASLASFTGHAYAQHTGILIEAEDYGSYSDIANVPIQTRTSVSCSGGYILAGLDYPGEWTTYYVPVPDYGYYKVNLVCRGDWAVNYQIRLELYPQTIGDPQTIQFHFTGLGYG